MAANTGKSNPKWIRVWCEDSAGAVQDISASVTDVTVPINYVNQDVTGFSNGVINVSIGQPAMNLTMAGVFSNTGGTGSHIVLTSILGKSDNSTDNSPYTVKFQIGVRKVPETGDPEFEGLFYLTEYNLAGDLTWTASFHPAYGTAPVWEAFP